MVSNLPHVAEQTVEALQKVELVRVLRLESRAMDMDECSISVQCVNKPMEDYL